MALHRRTRQQQIDLVVVISKALEVLDTPERRLAVSDSRVHVVLLAMLVNTEALKVDVSTRTELRLDRTGNVDRALEAEILHTVLHDGELERDLARHLDGAAERDLTVTLREMQVADAELGALDVHWQVDLGAAGQVLDVTVAAVLGTSWDCASAFFSDLFLDLVGCATGVDVDGLRWLSDVPVHVRAFLNQLALTPVPLGEDFGGWSAA